MAKNTVTFELGGRVEIRDLENGIIAFRRLISALTPSNERVAWVVEDLQPGSATATLRCDADNPVVAEQIVQDYETIGSSLVRYKKPPTQYNKRVKQAAEQLSLWRRIWSTSDLKHRITISRFMELDTPPTPWTVHFRQSASEPLPEGYRP